MRKVQARHLSPAARQRVVRDAVTGAAVAAIADTGAKASYKRVVARSGRLEAIVAGPEGVAVDAEVARCLANHYGWSLELHSVEAAAAFVARPKGGALRDLVRFGEPPNNCYREAVWRVILPHRAAELARLGLHQRAERRDAVRAVN